MIEAKSIVADLSAFEPYTLPLGLPNGPLYCAVAVGSGCSWSVAELVSRIINDKKLLNCTTMSPYAINQSRKDFDLGILISARGTHSDALIGLAALARRCRHVYVIGCSLNAGISQMVESHRNIEYISVPNNPPQGGFVPIASTASMYIWAARLFAQIDIAYCVEAFLLGCEALSPQTLAEFRVTPESPIVFVGSPWIEPAGRDFEARLIESGATAPIWTDVWSLAHGRYMPLARRKGLLVLCSALDDREEIDKTHAIVGQCVQCCRITAPYDGVLASVFFLGALMTLHVSLAYLQGLNPAAPENSHWGRELYGFRNEGLSH